MKGGERRSESKEGGGRREGRGGERGVTFARSTRAVSKTKSSAFNESTSQSTVKK